MANSMASISLTGAVMTALVIVGCGGRASPRSSDRTAGDGCQRFQKATSLSSTPLPSGEAFSDAASDGRNVYFSSAAGLYRVPVVGGALETVYSGAVGAFAAGGGVVAWVTVDATFKSTDVMVEDDDGVHTVALPDGTLPSAYPTVIADADGNVFFEVDTPTDGFQIWRWDPSLGSAAEMPGVGKGDGSFTNLYWADRGEVVWAGDAVYITDIASGSSRLVEGAGAGFGGLVGIDAMNLYGADGLCPKSACPFTVYGVARAGGTPFVAFQSDEAYWTNGLQADDSGLYWMDWVTRGIFHAALDPAGPAEHVVDPGSGIAWFALDACNLYWLEGNGTQPTVRLMAIAK